MPAVWTDVNIAFLSVVTSAKLNQIQANLPALAEGAAGAPRIVDAAISATADIAKSKISVTGVWAKSEQHAQTAYLDVAQSFTADYQQIEANITAAANRGLRIKDTGAAAGDKILVFGHTAQAPFIAKLNDDGTYDAGIVGWDSTGKQTAGTVPLARMRRVEASAENASTVTIPNFSETTLVSVDLGTVNAGDIILFTAPWYITKDGTAGKIQMQVKKNSGTATIYTGHNIEFLIFRHFTSNQAQTDVLTGIYRVSGSGTLSIKVTALIPSGEGGASGYVGLNEIHAIVLNNG